MCPVSITWHLLRGAGALALIALAVLPSSVHPWIAPPAVIGAVLLLRGCPMCWLVGLLERLSAREAAPASKATFLSRGIPARSAFAKWKVDPGSHRPVSRR